LGRIRHAIDTPCLIEIEMSDVASTLRLFAIAVLISFSLAAGTAALGTTMRAQAAAPAVMVFPAELDLS
jgi:hypothetical protein